MTPSTKIASVCACLAFSACSLQATTFSDVPEDAPYATALDSLFSDGIIEGYDDGTFRPNATINRAEFVKIVSQTRFDLASEETDQCMIRNKRADGAISFPDVPESSWFARHVCMAGEYKLIEGYPDGTFGPEKEITFVEASKIIVKLFDPFTHPGASVWYEPFVLKLEQWGAIPASIDALNKPLTRGEMAEMIYSAKIRSGHPSSSPSSAESLPVIVTKTEASSSASSRTVQQLLETPTTPEKRITKKSDLAVTARQDEMHVRQGELFTTVFTLKNNGPYEAPNTVFSMNPVTPDTLNQESMDERCVYSAKNNRIECALGTVDSGVSTTFTMKTWAAGTCPGSISHGASVTSDADLDPNHMNDAAVSEVTLNCPEGTEIVDLTSNIEYNTILSDDNSINVTFGVENRSSYDAMNVTLTLTPPSQLLVSGSLPAGCAQNGGNIVCSPGTVASGVNAKTTILFMVGACPLADPNVQVLIGTSSATIRPLASVHWGITGLKCPTH